MKQDEKKQIFVVLGANGNAGQAILRQLVKRNKSNGSSIHIRAVSRSGKIQDQKVKDHVESRPGDIFDLSQMREAVHGADIIFNCINLPYPRWVKDLPIITDHVLELAQQEESKLLVVDNLYMYHPSQTVNLKESSTVGSPTRKGKIRAKIAQRYLESGTQVTLLRGSDFYGPGVRNSLLGEMTMPDAIKKGKVTLYGRTDVPHSFTYIDDFAQAAINIALDDSAYGQVWHAPNAPAVSQEQLFSMVSSILGSEVKTVVLPELMLKFAGLFNPMAREFREMLYQFKQDFVVDHSKYLKHFSDEITPLEEGLKATIEWYQQSYL